MLKGHRLQESTIERLARKEGNVGVHTSLVREHIGDTRVGGIAADKTLEEGMAAVLNVKTVEQRVADLRLRPTLQHHCRQLLVVADEHKASYRLNAIGGYSAKRTNDIRLKNL